MENLVCFHARTKYLVGRANEWVANLLGPRQTSALQIKTKSAWSFKVWSFKDDLVLVEGYLKFAVTSKVQ